MFDPSQLEDYRAVKAPVALQARVEQAVAHSRRPVLRTVIPWIAAVAACLVLTVAGFAWFGRSPVTITASPSFVLARSSTQDVVPIVELTIRSEGRFTVDAIGEGVSIPRDTVPVLPLTAENSLSLWWEITSPHTTVTVNGHTYTLHADPVTYDVTVS